MKRLCAPALLLVISFFLSACAPSLAPLYRDYDMPSPDTLLAVAVSESMNPSGEPSGMAPDEGVGARTVPERIVAALNEAGWDTTATDLPHAIATKQRVLRRWGMYSIVFYLEVTPLGRDHVRIYIHPFRKYVFGKASKIQYLTRRIRSRFMSELDEAFSKHGLKPAGTPFERDDTILR